MTVGAQGTVTIWDRGVKLFSADDHGLTVSGRRVAAWAEISRFEDGGDYDSYGHTYWLLVVVLRTGKRVWVPAPKRPAPETVAVVNRVAERHGIPADVAGVPMKDGEPVRPSRWGMFWRWFEEAP